MRSIYDLCEWGEMPSRGKIPANMKPDNSPISKKMLGQYEQRRRRYESQYNFCQMLYQHEPWKSSVGKELKDIRTDFPTALETPTWKDMQELRNCSTRLFFHMQSLKGVCSLYTYKSCELDARIKGRPDLEEYQDTISRMGTQTDLTREIDRLKSMTMCCEREIVQRALRDFNESEEDSALSQQDHRVLRHCSSILTRKNFYLDEARLTRQTDCACVDASEDDLSDLPELVKVGVSVD